MKKTCSFFVILSISVSISSCFSDETDKGHTQSPDTKLRTLDDIRTKNIGVLLGSLQDEYVTQNFPNANIIRIDHSSDLAMSLQQGQCEAILLDNVTSSYLMKENGSFAYLDDSVTQNTFAVGFQSDKKFLQNKFNEFLKEIRNNGIYEKIYDRWIINSDTSVMPEIDNKGENGIIHMGTTGESIPFSFVKNNFVVGLTLS